MSGYDAPVTFLLFPGSAEGASNPTYGDFHDDLPMMVTRTYTSHYIQCEETVMETAKLFQNGQSQAVRLPKAFRLPGDKVYIKKVGNAVILLPLQQSWETLFESLQLFSDDFMDERNQPPQQQREAPFE